MSLIVPKEILLSTSNEMLLKAREKAGFYRNNDEVIISSDYLDKSGLTELLELAGKHKESKLARSIEVILLALDGVFAKPIPNFNAFKEVLTSYLKHNAIDGWIYVECRDGQMLPELVTDIFYKDGGRSDSPPSVTIKTLSYTMSDGGGVKMGVRGNSHTFYPAHVARKRIDSILQERGIFKETATLKAQYQAAIERHQELAVGAYSRQFRATGPAIREIGHYGSEVPRFSSSRVIWDLTDDACGSVPISEESVIFDGAMDQDGHSIVPKHPLTVVFELECQSFFWINTCHLTPHVYDKSLGEKLILPATHRDLLDVLTTDIEALTGDIIEGKSAGNIILCKGIPGVGKTLTAEVYAELIERPLYKVHSGTLGTTAKDIEKSLKTVFQRADRWGCVLLLDEADVFVARRGKDIEQNAIVAEFLRTLEYFAGLLFLTTNRPDDIDEAIISRCAAVISYNPPTTEDARKIWLVLAQQFNALLDERLLDGLLVLFPAIAPRDIKMLLRLALRMSASRNLPLSLDLFRQCAMFRAIEMAPSGAAL